VSISFTMVPLSINSYSTRRNVSTFSALQTDGEDLQRQLATGKVADNYSGLGDQALKSLDLRSRLANIEGWSSTAADAQLRLKLMDQALTGMDSGTTQVANQSTMAFTLLSKDQTAAQLTALQQLRTTIDLMNVEVNGRYLMSGRASDTEPVVDADTILNGTGSQAGLKTLIAERKAADVGAAGMGRLTVGTSNMTATSGTVTIAEEAAGLPFGMKLAAGASSNSNAAVTGPAGSPASLSFAFTGQLADGDTVSVALTMPDGTSKTATFTARSASNPLNPAPAFIIGADVQATAQNFATALTNQIKTEASTTLVAASAMKAATEFFAGTAANPPKRVAGPPFDTATTQVAGTTTNTVIWYKGEVGTDNPRDTAPVKVDGGSPVGIGVRANEAGFQSMLASLAAMAAVTFPTPTTSDKDMYAALADRVVRNIKGTTPGQMVKDIQAQLGYASASVKAATDRNTDVKTVLGQALSGVEDADKNEVVAALLSLQTRLQASYQTTSMLSKMSLVNYLS
jgi:flagellin-like hook-associated protein FlgL